MRWLCACFALRKIVVQEARVDPENPPLNPCTCGTLTYMGIPLWYILWERMQGGGMFFLTDTQAHQFYDGGNRVEILVGRWVFPRLNSAAVKDSGRPKMTLG